MTEREYEGIVGFGEEVRAFCRGPIGKYLLNKAADERDAAIDELVVVDPGDEKKIMQLQSVIARSNGFGQWLAEAIEAAEDVKRILAGEEP